MINWDKYYQTIYLNLNANTWIIIDKCHFLMQTFLCFFELFIE